MHELPQGLLVEPQCLQHANDGGDVGTTASVTVGNGLSVGAGVRVTARAGSGVRVAVLAKVAAGRGLSVGAGVHVAVLVEVDVGVMVCVGDSVWVGKAPGITGEVATRVGVLTMGALGAVQPAMKPARMRATSR